MSNPFVTSLSFAPTMHFDRLNFLAWKSQVLVANIGHGLESFLFSPNSPPKFLAYGAINPDFTI